MNFYKASWNLWKEIVIITAILHHHQFDEESLRFDFSHEVPVPGAEHRSLPPTRA